MTPHESWKPHKYLALLLGIFAALCVIFVDMGTDTRLSVTLMRCLGSGVVAALTGFGVGWLLKYLIREAPEPKAKIFFNVPDELEYLQPEGKSSDGKSENPNPEGSRNDSSTPKNEREDAMVSEVT